MHDLGLLVTNETNHAGEQGWLSSSVNSQGLVLAPHKEPCRTALVAEALLVIYSHLTLRLATTIDLGYWQSPA